MSDLAALVAQIEAANTAEDTEAGAGIVTELQGMFATLPHDTLDTMDTGLRSRLMGAILEHERLLRCGPVIDYPLRHVELIEKALDDNDGDEARRLMGELQGSFASGGPTLTREEGIRLVRLYRRSEWDAGPAPFTAPEGGQQ
jgi:hypothetical protein